MVAPKRSCVVCRTKTNKAELNRFIWDGQKPVLDIQQLLSGRGAYSCRSEKCMNQFLSKEQKWQKAFRK